MQQTFILQRGARAAARIGARSGASQSAQRTWAAGAAARPKKRRRRYRYAFNGMEKDDSLKTWTDSQGKVYPIVGASYDFGARMYDPRVGRWYSRDPLESKYPDLSPYNYVGNSPILFIDFDGEDFGIKTDHEAKTIVIVANIYVLDDKTYNQALEGAKLWNAKTAEIDGYTVSFDISVKDKVEPLMTREQIANTFFPDGDYTDEQLDELVDQVSVNNAMMELTSDPIGNLYTGLKDKKNTKSISLLEEDFIGGSTINGEKVGMNFHGKYRDMGDYALLVAHEIGHLLGLKDLVKNGDNTYYSDDGIMVYNGLFLKPISDQDVSVLIRYASDYMKKGKAAENKGVNKKAAHVEDLSNEE